MLLITNIVSSHIRTNSLKQIWGNEYFATIVMDGRKKYQSWNFFALFVWLIFFFFNLGGIFYLLRISQWRESVSYPKCSNFVGWILITSKFIISSFQLPNLEIFVSLAFC